MFRKSKVIAFIRNQGFYIALAVCIAIVGVVSFLAIRANESEAEPGEIGVGNSMDESIRDAATPAPAFTAAPIAATPSPSATAEPKTDKPQPAVKMVMPIEGEITASFSEDVLTYNKTLKTWMTHNGIDIAAEEGAEVCAALAGEVKDVYADNSRGLTVVISHSGEKETLYVGLARADVEVGDKVNAGTVIGTLGTPAFEAHSGPHLHFEYVIKGEFADPKKYM